MHHALAKLTQHDCHSYRFGVCNKQNTTCTHSTVLDTCSTVFDTYLRVFLTQGVSSQSVSLLSLRNWPPNPLLGSNSYFIVGERGGVLKSGVPALFC